MFSLSTLPSPGYFSRNNSVKEPGSVLFSRIIWLIILLISEGELIGKEGPVVAAGGYFIRKVSFSDAKRLIFNQF